MTMTTHAVTITAPDELVETTVRPKSKLYTPPVYETDPEKQEYYAKLKAKEIGNPRKITVRMVNDTQLVSIDLSKKDLDRLINETKDKTGHTHITLITKKNGTRSLSLNTYYKEKHYGKDV